MNPPTYTDDTRGTRFSDVWPPASSDGNVSEYDFSSFLPSSSGMPQGSLEAFSDAGLWSTPPSALSPQALASLAASGDAPQLKSSIGPIRRDTGTPSSASPHLVSTQYTSGSSSGSASLLAANAAHGACGKDGEHGDKEPPAPPVKNACTFCRSRKSRCNGKQPCAKCVARGREDDCVFTVSRRGGKPKPKAEPATPAAAPFERHLEQLFGLSDLPLAVRVPGVVPQLRQFQTAPGPGGSDWDYDGSSTAASSVSVLAPAENSNSWTLSAQQLGMPVTPPVAVSAESASGLIDDYYRYLYRFIPVFLSPAYKELGAGLSTTQSPFLLALQCILPLLRDEEQKPNATMGQALNFGTSEKHARVRDVTTYFERAASEAIDAALERIEAPDVDAKTQLAMALEVIQALCVISIYEYGSGRAIKSRLKTDQALGLAMSKGLHRLAPPSSHSQGAPSSFQPADQAQGNGAQLTGAQHAYASVPAGELYEMKKRAWWTVWNLVMWSAYNTARTPTIRADDPRVRSELPTCHDEGAWADNVQTMQALLLVQDRVLALSNLDNSDDLDGAWTPSGLTASPAGSFSPFGGSRTPGSAGSGSVSGSVRHAAPVIPGSFSSLSPVASRREILRSMEELDVALQERIAAIEAAAACPPKPARDTSGLPSTHPDAIEAGLAAYLRGSSAIVLYASSLTLHIGQAFQGATLFERKLCFLSSVTEAAGDMATCQVPMPETMSYAFSAVGTQDSSWLTQVPQHTPVPVAPAPERSLYERGPFLPRLSLDRCVHASKCLLEISRPANKDPPPNPFGACSYVLISFVCLMQALAISGGVQDDEASEAAPNGAAPKNYSRELLLSAKHGAAFKMQNGAEAHMTDTRSVRLQRLEKIWQRVNEAHERLSHISESWAIAIPMREEVSNCLAASKALLTAPGNEAFENAEIKSEPQQMQQQNNYGYTATQ